MGKLKQEPNKNKTKDIDKNVNKEKEKEKQDNKTRQIKEGNDFPSQIDFIKKPAFNVHQYVEGEQKDESSQNVSSLKGGMESLNIPSIPREDSILEITKMNTSETQSLIQIIEGYGNLKSDGDRKKEKGERSGIMNYGNTCYFSSLMQTLTSCYVLRKELLELDIPDKFYKYT